MFTVELYAQIRRAVMVEGLSRREAARRFGVHRNTITKMLTFSVPPGYRRGERPPSKKLGPHMAWIDAFLKATARFTRSSGTRRGGFSSGCAMSKGFLAATRSSVNMWQRRDCGGGRCSCR